MSDLEKWKTMERNAQEALRRNLSPKERKIEEAKLKDARQQIDLAGQRAAKERDIAQDQGGGKQRPAKRSDDCT